MSAIVVWDSNEVVFLLLILNHALDIVHRISMRKLTVHLGPADKFLFLRLPSISVVVCERAEGLLAGCANDVAAAARPLVIRIYRRFV